MITFQQCQTARATTGTFVQVSITSTSGNLLVFFAGETTNNTATLTVTDSTGGSNTWTQTTSGYSAQSTTKRCGMFFSNTSAGVTTVKGDWGITADSTHPFDAFCLEASTASGGEDTSKNNNGGVGGTSTSGSYTTTNSVDIIVFGTIMGTGGFSSPAAGTGYTIPTNGTNTEAIISYKITSATEGPTTTTHTWTTNHSWANVLGAFKATVVSTTTWGWYAQFDAQQDSIQIVGY